MDKKMTGKISAAIFIIAVFICIFSSSTLTANPITLEESVQRGWVRTTGNSGADTAFDVALDNNGNVYVVGDIGKKVSLNREITVNLKKTSQTNSHDAFIAKYDSKGEYRWTKTLDGDRVSARQVAVGKFGTIYIAGTFRGTCDFNPGDKVENRTSHDFKGGPAWDYFVCKLNSTGRFIWVTTFGGDDSIIKSDISMEIDGSSNVYIGGWSAGNLEFNLESGLAQYPAIGRDDIFVCKINSAGNIDWGKRWGSEHADKFSDIAVGSDGTVYVAGSTFGMSVLNKDNGSIEVNADKTKRVYLWRLNSDGEFESQWAWDESFSFNRCKLYLDRQDNLYMSSCFKGQFDVNPNGGEEIITATGSNDIFITMLDKQGDFQWVRTFGGDEKNMAMDISIDKSGFIFVAGFYGGNGDFNPGNGTAEMTATHDADTFLCKFTRDGDYKWSRSWKGDGKVTVFSLATDPNGNVYMSGRYSKTIDFAPGPTNDTKTASGFSDAFLLKLTPQGKYLGWLDF
jgi:hypothetical protein